MATFLMKTEPGTYSYADLERDKKTVWDGVANPVALANMRSMAKGDEVFIYHTGDEKAIVGLARVTKPAFEDPKNPGVNAKGEPKNAVVELEAVKPAKTPVELARVKAEAKFKDFPLVTQGRLSVMPVPPAIDAVLRKWAGL